MPLALGSRVEVIHIVCSSGGLAGQPSCTPANQRDEAIDTEGEDAYYDDVHPPLHVDHHNLPTSLPYPRLKSAHQRSEELAGRMFRIAVPGYGHHLYRIEHGPAGLALDAEQAVRA